MTDPERTIPPMDRYKKAETAFDKAWSAIGASPWTLAAFVLYSIGLVAFGFWAALKP